MPGSEMRSVSVVFFMRRYKAKMLCDYYEESQLQLVRPCQSQALREFWEVLKKVIRIFGVAIVGKSPGGFVVYTMYIYIINKFIIFSQ